VTREVLVRKLTFLRQLLRDLARFEDATMAEVRAQHYTLERLFELLVATASDIVFHLLAERGVAPQSYREAFQLAAVHGLLPADLAEQMQDAAAMRNVIVHMYQEIDYTILHASIRPALRDFGVLVALLEKRLDEADAGRA